MTTLRPYTVARFGVYAAAGVSLLSVWLGTRAGASFDYALLRSVFFFVIVAALGFGAEAVLLLTPVPPPVVVDLEEPQESIE
ncbi:MAG: hypothetical protein ABI577_02075 [bacterium]